MTLIVALSVSLITNGQSNSSDTTFALKNRITIGYTSYYVPKYQFASFQKIGTPTYIGYRRQVSASIFMIAEYSRLLINNETSINSLRYSLISLEYFNPRIGIGKRVLNLRNKGMISVYGKAGYRGGDEAQIMTFREWFLPNGEKVYEPRGKRLLLNDLSLHAAIEIDYTIFKRWSLGLNFEYQYFIKLKDKNAGNTFNGEFRYSNNTLSNQICLSYHF